MSVDRRERYRPISHRNGSDNPANSVGYTIAGNTGTRVVTNRRTRSYSLAYKTKVIALSSGLTAFGTALSIYVAFKG